MSQLTPLEQLVMTAFEAQPQHDGSSLVSWLNGGCWDGRERSRRAAEDMLKAMAKKGLLVTDRVGWFQLPNVSD